MSKLWIFLLSFAVIFSATWAKRTNVIRIVKRKGTIGLVGGPGTSVHSIPFQAAIELDGEYLCSGSIVSKDAILTASNCVDAFLPSDLTVRVGSRRVGKGGKVASVKKITIHPDYDIKTSNNDVAVITLKKSLSFDSEIEAVKLAEKDDVLQTNKTVFITGWGFDISEGVINDKLIWTNLTVLPEQICSTKEMHRPFTSSMYCADYLKRGNIDNCLGARGGPAVQQGVQFGVVVNNAGCKIFHEFSLLTAVPKVREWIDGVIKNI